MNKYIKLSTITIFFLFAFSCNTSKKKEYQVLYEIPIGEKRVQIQGVSNADKTGFEDSKRLVAYSETNEVLQTLDIYMLDVMAAYHSYIDENTFCMHIRYPTNGALYAFILFDEKSSSFEIYPTEGNFTASILATKENIYFSTEFDNDTIRKIDRKTLKETAFPGYFPCADLFFYEDDLTPHFEYDKKIYEIKDGAISISKKDGKIKKALYFNSFPYSGNK